MPCEVWRGKVEAYADGELPLADANAFAAHMRTCLECASRVLELTQLKRSVAIAGKRYEPSAEFRNRISALATKRTRRQNGRFWALITAPALAVLFVSLLVIFQVQRQNLVSRRTYNELADIHVATLASGTPVDVVSSDRHTVKPWFQGRIPFAFNLPELQGSDFTLLGGRVAYLQQSPAAHLIYQLRKHELSVFIVQDREIGSSNSTAKTTQAASFTAETWTHNGLRFFIVGDVGAADIDSLGKLLRSAQ